MKAIAPPYHRLRALIGKALPPSAERLSANNNINYYYYYYSTMAASPRVSNFLSGDDSGGGSAAYRRALNFQRPTVVKFREKLYNSASFIGTVALPPKITATTSGGFGVYTVLSVAASRQSNNTFRILLQMWDNMAEISLKHLKPNDFIYVSGILGSYEKADADGRLRTYYKVTAKELNYIADASHSQGRDARLCGKSKSQRGTDGRENKDNRIHLWQIYFSNPFEWWDNRKSKRYSWSPDFRHKDTQEALWLYPDDPPWIKKQLQLLDSRRSSDQGASVRSYPRLSTWEYDDY